MILRPALAPLAAALLLATGGVATAETLRWARAGDSLTLDPHAQNEGPTHTLSHQMYEGLLQRDMRGEIIPALATNWEPTDDPTVWRFDLREGVTFHEGQDFTADDVVFSLNRAKKPTSAMKELLTSVAEVRKVDDYTVEIVTDGPAPLLPANLFITHDLSVVRYMADTIGVLYLGKLVESAPRETLFTEPAHPYTRMLLDAVPRLDGFGRTHDTDGGEVPDPIDPPAGCHYHPRCAHRIAECERRYPPIRALGPREVACFEAERVISDDLA